MPTHLLIFAIAALIISIAAVLLVFRLWRAINELEIFLRETRQETTPILKKTNSTLDRLERMSQILEKRLNETDEDVHEALENLLGASEDIRLMIQNWQEKLNPDGRWSGWISTLVASGYQTVQRFRDKKQTRKGGKTNG